MESPTDRFERERPFPMPPAAQPHRSRAVPPEPEREAPRAPETATPQIVEVERRPPAEYAKIAGGVS